MTLKCKSENSCWTYSSVHYELTSFTVPVRFRPDCKLNFVIIYTICFAIFKNDAHSLEPGEVQSYSASHQASNYVQHS